MVIRLTGGPMKKKQIIQPRRKELEKAISDFCDQYINDDDTSSPTGRGCVLTLRVYLILLAYLSSAHQNEN